MRRWMMLGVGAVVVALAGCGSSEPVQPAGDRVRPLSAASATGSAGVQPLAEASRGHASAADLPTTPASPLATVSGSVDDSRLDLLGVRRSGGSVQVRLRLRTGDRLFEPEVLSADGETADLSGARLVDPVNLREHLPLQDAGGNCMCTRLEDNPYVLAENVDLSVQFAAPPADVHEVSILVPTFASFDGVRIG